MVAGYRIERVLGTGGMGTVYLAKNPVLPRHDALKVLSAKLSGDPGFRERFVREADIASVLDHPNIVSIYSRGETDDGHLWIAMQYVPGTDAEAALRAGTMTPIRAVHIVGEIAKALDFAHQRNVVHHDVKPANFLLSNEAGEDEKVLLGDFGTARALDDVGMSMTGSLTATLAYAAPEVIAGGPIDGRADLYSLGCTLFRMLTGKKPFFQADGMAAEMMAHLHDDPPLRLGTFAVGAAAAGLGDHEGVGQGPDAAVSVCPGIRPCRRRGPARSGACRGATTTWPAVVAAVAIRRPHPGPRRWRRAGPLRHARVGVPPIGAADNETGGFLGRCRPGGRRPRRWPGLLAAASVTRNSQLGHHHYDAIHRTGIHSCGPRGPSPAESPAASGLSPRHLHTDRCAGRRARQGVMRPERRSRRPAIGDLHIGPG